MAAQYELLKELLNSGTKLGFGQEMFFKFYQAFILNDRWVQYIQGVGTTLLVTAPSGTGKSTHYCLWKLLCPDEIQIINGDKPIVYIENDEVFVTTSPWTGKENMSQRLTAKLGGIIILEQSDSNEITRLTVHESAGKVFSQFLFDCNTEQEAKTACRIAEKMLKTPVWLLKNRGDIESAKLCRKTLQTYLESSASH